jgi:hypothetical protein
VAPRTSACAAEGRVSDHSARLGLRGVVAFHRRIDRAKKLAIYAREGAVYAWLVEPLQQTLEVLRLESGRWSLLAACSARDRVRAEPFEAIEFDLATLWAD